MTKCTIVQLEDGTQVRVQAAGDKKLPPSDLAALEEWVAKIKASQAARRKTGDV